MLPVRVLSQRALTVCFLYQDLTADAVAATSKGCVWNQDLPKLFHKGGLKVKRFEQYLGGLIALVEASPAFKLSV